MPLSIYSVPDVAVNRLKSEKAKDIAVAMAMDLGIKSYDTKADADAALLAGELEEGDVVVVWEDETRLNGDGVPPETRYRVESGVLQLKVERFESFTLLANYIANSRIGAVGGVPAYADPLASMGIISAANPVFAGGMSTSNTAEENTAALEAAAAMLAEGGELIIPAGVFDISETTIVLPHRSTLTFIGTLRYDGTGVGLTIGSKDQVCHCPNVQGVRLITTTSDWSSVGRVGVRFINLYSGRIDIPQVEGFWHGIECYGMNGQGFSYNHIYLGRIVDNKRSIVFGSGRGNSSGSGGWSNENHVYGGRFAFTSAITEGAGHWHIWVLDGDTTILTASVDDTATTFEVEDASVFDGIEFPFNLWIEREEVEVSAINGNELTVSRGVGSAAAASHAAGLPIYYQHYRQNNVRFYSPSLEEATVDGGGKAMFSAGAFVQVYSPRIEGYETSWHHDVIYFYPRSLFNYVGLGIDFYNHSVVDYGSGNSWWARDAYNISGGGLADTETVPKGALRVRNWSSGNYPAIEVLGPTGIVGGQWLGNGELRVPGNRIYAQTGFRWATADATYNDRGLFVGSGSPEGVVSATTGSLYANVQGGWATGLWLKVYGTGNTGWVPVQEVIQMTSASPVGATREGTMAYLTDVNVPVWFNGTSFQRAYLRGTATWNPPLLTDGASASTTVTVPGVTSGMPVQAGVSFTATMPNWELKAFVTATDTVTVVLTNQTGGSVDLGNITVTVVAFP